MFNSLHTTTWVSLMMSERNQTKKTKKGDIPKLKDSIKFKTGGTDLCCQKPGKGLSLVGGGRFTAGRDKEGHFWGVVMVCSLIGVLITQMGSVWENSSSCTFLTCSLFHVYFIFQRIQTVISNND